jgi:hypothetical protein
MIEGQTDSKNQTKEDAIDYKAKLEEKEKEIAAVVAKNQELINEKRRIAERIEEAEREKDEQKTQKMIAAGRFEELSKSAQEKERLYAEKLKRIEDERALERTRNEAMRLATELADGYNAELLTEFIHPRIKYNKDGSISVLNAQGEETVSTLDDLKREFETSPRYKALLRGSKASGGGAQGSGSGSNGKATGRVVTRSEFNTWKPRQQMDFMTSGGKTIKG